MFYWISTIAKALFDSLLIIKILSVICGIFIIGYLISKNTITKEK